MFETEIKPPNSDVQKILKNLTNKILAQDAAIEFIRDYSKESIRCVTVAHMNTRESLISNLEKLQRHFIKEMHSLENKRLRESKKFRNHIKELEKQIEDQNFRITILESNE